LELRARPCLKRQKLGGFDDFSATPAETCAAVPKGRRHFLFCLVFVFSGLGLEERDV
jgi:hypothetical protein